MTDCGIGNPDRLERSVFNDDCVSKGDELTPFDDDNIREEYSDEEW